MFDPDARKAHLRGFSERKRQRRAYGLAMQKVKDRKAKLEQRKKEKKDELERVQEAEKQKEVLLEEELLNQGILKDDDEDEKSHASVDKKEQTESQNESTTKKTKYEDKQAEKKWGGSVTVTTTVLSLDDLSDDDDDMDTHGKKKAVDHEQKKAGDVQKYLDELKGNMPGKRKQTNKRVMTKGKNGAAEMRGMGGSSNLRMAQKVLGKAKAKAGPGGKFANKGKKRKGKR